MTRPDRSSTTVQTEKQPGVLVDNSYGKSKVRLTKVTRHPDRHVLQEICVDIQLEGEFGLTYTTGDNSQVVATDSMKNIVYLHAANHPLTNIESFGKSLAEHMLSTYEQVRLCTIKLVEELWHRIPVNGKPDPHSFYGAGGEKRMAEIRARRPAIEIKSGIENLKVVKTTDSEFWGFVRDESTTLPDVKDRIFGTSVSLNWLYTSDNPDFNSSYEQVRKIVIEVFATQHSLSVQHTMHDIAQAVLKKLPDIREISLVMPNEHRIPFNMQPFGKENTNEIFITTEEPYGLISATIKRV